MDTGSEFPHNEQGMVPPQGMHMVPQHMAPAYLPQGMYLSQPGFMPGMMMGPGGMAQMPRPFNGSMQPMLVPQGMQGMAPQLVPMYAMHQGMQRPPMYASQPFGPMPGMGHQGMPMASGPLGPPMQGGHPSMPRRPNM